MCLHVSYRTTRTDCYHRLPCHRTGRSPNAATCSVIIAHHLQHRLGKHCITFPLTAALGHGGTAIGGGDGNSNEIRETCPSTDHTDADGPRSCPPLRRCFFHHPPLACARPCDCPNKFVSWSLRDH